jgi:putative hydrolase of the HAD superfamily
MFDLIAFDADDTLWENNALYLRVREELKAILARYSATDGLEERLEVIEEENLPYFGYGVVGFAFSLIEAAVDQTSGRVSAQDIQTIINLAKGMIDADIHLYPEAEPTLRALAPLHPLALITKGDLSHQQTKLNRSGLGQYFQNVEIVSAKNSETYAAILKKYGVEPQRFLMVGDSIRSDVLPVLELGGWSVLVHNDLTWTHEIVQRPQGFDGRFFELDRLSLIPALLEKLERSA